jgi:hypothetical protein
MKHRSLSALEATLFLKKKWDATWPNDSFVLQLIEYEKDLEKRKHK